VGSLLQGKKCLVSGVGPGLGREIALAFAREGANAVPGPHPESTDPEDCRRIVDAAVADLGRLDVLVLHAVTDDASVSDVPQPFETADLDDWRRIMDVNLFGALQLAHAVIPVMKAQGAGSIVFVSSRDNRNASPFQGGDATAKAARYTAAQVLAKELGPHGIRVNTIVLGSTVSARDCADAVVFFASELSSVVTGQGLDLTGMIS